MFVSGSPAGARYNAARTGYPIDLVKGGLLAPPGNDLPPKRTAAQITLFVLSLLALIAYITCLLQDGSKVLTITLIVICFGAMLSSKQLRQNQLKKHASSRE